MKTEKHSPSATDRNGQADRNEKGQFVAGNHAATGNPHAKRVAEIRSLLLTAVSDEDLQDVIQAVVKKAKTGDIAAARELFDRCIGKALQALAIDASLEQRVNLPDDYLQFLDWRADQEDEK